MNLLTKTNTHNFLELKLSIIIPFGSDLLKAYRVHVCNVIDLQVSILVGLDAACYADVKL